MSQAMLMTEEEGGKMEREIYYCYPLSRIKEEVAEQRKSQRDERMLLDYLMVKYDDESVYFENFMRVVRSLAESKIPVEDIKVAEYYRIGEPQIDLYGGCSYLNSHNTADEKREKGVSVINTDWLNSLKSVFWGVENGIKILGVWKIKGIFIGEYGGDDEPLIYPVDWAEKTDIQSIDELRKVVEI